MNNLSLKRNWVPLLLGAGALIVAHYVALLFRTQLVVSLCFPPAGVAIALSLWFGPAAAVVTGLVSVVMAPLWGSDGWTRWIGLTDGVEPLIAWWLYRQVWQRSLIFNQLKDVGAFIISAPVAGCLASALVGCFTAALLGNLGWEKMLDAIFPWWLGNALGTMAIAPVALLTLTPVLQQRRWISGGSDESTANRSRTSHTARLRAEAALIFGISLGVGLLSVAQTQNTGFAFQQFAFLNFIPILWASLRFGTTGGAATASLCVFAAVCSYVLKYPHALELEKFPLDPGILLVHKFTLLTQCLVGLLMGTAIGQQTQMQVKLAISQVKIEEYEARSRLNETLEQINHALAQSNLQLERANAEKDRLLVREQAARSQAETANRLKDEFLAVLSHELRSPLNPILGWSKLLQRGKVDAATTRKALETIDRNAKLQANLIDDLLDVSRILRGKLLLNKINLDPSLPIRSALETVRLSAEAKAIALTFTNLSTEHRHLVHADPSRLQQVVVNLLTNAIKFTPTGGQVEVTLRYKPGYDKNGENGKHCINESEQEADYVEISVCDTGRGIHAEFLPRVFDHFRQQDSSTTRTFGGLGLGLAIVRHLVELHEGTVEAQSEGENRGATFIVRLPLVHSCHAMLPEVAPQVPNPVEVLKGRRVLVVDDDADARELLQYILEAEQAIAILATCAEEAIAQVQQSPPDLILSDISMPEVDGYHLIQQIRAQTGSGAHRIPAIALTANAKDADRLTAIAAGFDAHLAKPITPEVLLAQIEKLLKSTSELVSLS